MMRAEIRLAGSGGQGIILASKIVAEAAGLYHGYNVVQTQIYGAAARGEISKADVILDEGNIYTLEISTANIFVCLYQEAYDKYHKELRENGLIILDDFYVKKYDKLNNRNQSFPITRSAIKLSGNTLVSNIIAVGILTILGNYFKEEYVIKAVKNRVPKAFLDINLKALEKGFELGRKKKPNVCGI